VRRREGAPRRGALCANALSLSFHKERAKERELGRSLRGLPSCAQKRLHGNHVFAKINKFRLCVGNLTENRFRQAESTSFHVCFLQTRKHCDANTEVARTMQKQKFLLSATHLMLVKILRFTP